MASNMLLNALSITNGYLIQNYSRSELAVIREEIKIVLGKYNDSYMTYNEMYSYEEVQEILSNIGKVVMIDGFRLSFEFNHGI